MAMQELEWHSIDDVEVEENKLASVEDIRPEIGTPAFEGDIAPIWSDDIDESAPICPEDD